MAADYVAVASYGVYSETYGNAELANRCNLYASLGLLKDAPNVAVDYNPAVAMYHFRQMVENS